MKKLLAAAALLLTVPTFAVAQNVGTCGWGSKLFDGQGGIAPQSLAVTTNGTSGNQTFGITSGTSGCTQDGVVRSAWRTAAYIDSNMSRLARDISRGQGESLDSLALLLNVQPEDRGAFDGTLQKNFSEIFSDKDASTEDVLVSLKQVLAADTVLVRYSQNV
jgi:hypothetical protein